MLYNVSLKLILNSLYLFLTSTLPISHSLSPLVTTSFFSISLFFSICFLYLCESALFYYIHQFFVCLDSKYQLYHAVFVFVWIISVSVMPSNSIHVAANIKFHSFLWLNSIYILHLHLSVDGHLVASTTVNLNTRVHMAFKNQNFCFFFIFIHRSEIAL